MRRAVQQWAIPRIPARRFAESTPRTLFFSSCLLQPVQYASSRRTIHGGLGRARLKDARSFCTTIPKYKPEDVGSTIYALSTASGKAAIAVIRVSGPACREVYQSLCPLKPLPKPRQAVVRTLYDPASPPPQSVLDPSALILYFSAPQTVTGEDVIEFHAHGGLAVVKAVLSAISRCSTPTSTIRYAEPGEFTKRAFLNGRMDLTQVEALGDTLSATTEQQRRLSIRGTTRALAKRYEEWRSLLLYARGELEALIDFSEDQHFDESPEELASAVAIQIKALRAQIDAHRENAVRGELLRNGIKIALLGAPNAGKSSLLNIVVGREAAIVSTEAGTTRDVVEVGIDVGGWFCRLADTAGLRASIIGRASPFPLAESTSTLTQEAPGAIESEGIRRAKERALDSDVVIIVMSYEPPPSGGDYIPSTTQEVRDTINQCLAQNIKVIVAVNKSDRLVQSEPNTQRSLTFDNGTIPMVSISCKEATSQMPTAHDNDPGNIQTLLRTMTDVFKQMTTPLVPEQALQEGNLEANDAAFWQESLGATERQRVLLVDCSRHLDEFLAEVTPSQSEREVARHDYDGGGGSVDIVVAAESLRAAADCLSRITGKGEAGDVEEVLGVVFEKFCVGK